LKNGGENKTTIQTTRGKTGGSIFLQKALQKTRFARAATRELNFSGAQERKGKKARILSSYNSGDQAFFC
jgi:hypothetical protein